MLAQRRHVLNDKFGLGKDLSVDALKHETTSGSIEISVKRDEKGAVDVAVAQRRDRLNLRLACKLLCDRLQANKVLIHRAFLLSYRLPSSQQRVY